MLPLLVIHLLLKDGVGFDLILKLLEEHAINLHPLMTYQVFGDLENCVFALVLVETV
ncbi:hypothetical protein D3C81_2202150 [compost metagenome]